MFLDKTIFRVSASVTILLLLAFAVTGFISSMYRREKLALGERQYRKGRQLEARADLEGAVEEYRKALLFSPDKQEYAFSFAAALVSAGRIDEAESRINQLLQEDPTNGVLNLMRGRIAMQRRQLTKAIDFYERAVYEYWPPARTGERREARWELIRLLDSAGRREESIGELMTMYANSPADTPLRIRIGFDLLRRSATSEGMQVFRDITRVSPRNGQGHRGLGESLLTDGDFVAARHELERAVRLDSKDQASADMLTQTNTIIDLDPAIPSLTTAERYRRSQNLLRRVLGDLGTCADAGADTQVMEARDLVGTRVSRDPDLALRLQSMALQLWNRRGDVCGSSKAMNDPSVATVLARVANE